MNVYKPVILLFPEEGAASTEKLHSSPTLLTFPIIQSQPWVLHLSLLEPARGVAQLPHAVNERGQALVCHTKGILKDPTKARKQTENKMSSRKIP